MAEPDLFRKIGWIGEIRPGFQQQHGRTLVCRQSAGQHRASRSPADDHFVIFHGLSLPDLERILESAATIVSSFRGGRNKRTHAECSWLPPSKRSPAVVIRALRPQSAINASPVESAPTPPRRDREL